MPDRPAVSPLESHLGYCLRVVSNHVSQAFAARVEARGVTVAEWVVARALFDVGRVNPSELAETVGLTRGAVSKLVDRLEAKGHVARRAEKGDRRFQTVALTAAGRRLVPVLAGLADENDEEFFGHLTKKERAALEDALTALARRHGLKGAPVE